MPWTRIRRHLQDRRSPELVQRVRDHERRRVDHQLGSLSYPSRWNHAPWIVCVNDKGMTWEEVDQWHREVHRPEGRRLDEERRMLLQELYPLTAPDAEPTDLLELLAATVGNNL